MRFHLLTGGCALATFLLIGCATDVNGVVRDAETNRPIEGATVRIGEDVTSTDSDGFYSLEADADDDDPQKFHIDAPGYMSVSDVRMFDDETDPQKIDFNLRPTQMEKERTGEANRANPNKVDVDVRSESRSVEEQRKIDEQKRLDEQKKVDEGIRSGQSDAKATTSPGRAEATATGDGKVEAGAKAESGPR